VIDLVVPTIPGREESLERCISSFELRTDDLTAIVVKNSPTCGEGWMQGLESSTAPYVLLVADDIECASEDWDRVCRETVDAGNLPCPRVYLPTGEVESQGGDMNAFQHIRAMHRRDGAWCDYTTVPFCSREQIEAIGMVPIHYGSDVWVSYRGRQLGYETVLRHGYDLVHHREQTGRGAGYAQQERDAMDTETLWSELAEVE
jgi:hypothetical protein